MRNICCHYIKDYIMTTNISFTSEDVFLLYETIYNEKYLLSYTLSCIITTKIPIIQDNVYDNKYFSLYKRVYNDNKCFLIYGSVFLIIQDDV